MYATLLYTTAPNGLGGPFPRGPPNTHFAWGVGSVLTTGGGGGGGRERHDVDMLSDRSGAARAPGPGGAAPGPPASGPLAGLGIDRDRGTYSRAVGGAESGSRTGVCEWDSSCVCTQTDSLDQR